MEDFQDLFNKAVKIKNAEMANKRKLFEQQPQFIKAGLYYWPKFEATRQQQFQQKYFASELIKSQGNAYFKTKQFDKAAKEYEQSLTIFRYIRNRNKNWRKEGIIDTDLEYIDEQGNTQYEMLKIRQLKLVLYHNLAVSYLKLKQYQLTKKVCDEALNLDPKSTKALFRRAKSYILDNSSGYDEYKLAQKDLKSALEVEPKDGEIQELYINISQEIQKMKQSQQQMGKNMFLTKQQRLQKQQQELEQQKKSIETQQKQLIQQLEDENDPQKKLLAQVRQRILLEQQNKSAQQQQQQQFQSQQQELNQQQMQQQRGRSKPKDTRNEENKKPKVMAVKKGKKKQVQSNGFGGQTAANINNNQQNQENMDDGEKSTKSEPVIAQATINKKQKAKKAQKSQQQDVQYVQDDQNQQKQNQNVQNFWKMFNIQKDYDNFDYELSYHMDPTIPIPLEIQELGKFISTKGREMVKLYEQAGKIKEANELEDKLDKAKAAKNQLEKIARLDFSRPTQQLQDIAQKYGIDLQDDGIKNEFKKIQQQNLIDIRQWLSANDQQITTQQNQEQQQQILSNGSKVQNQSQSVPIQENNNAAVVLANNSAAVPGKKKKKNKKKKNKEGNQDVPISLEDNQNQILLNNNERSLTAQKKEEYDKLKQNLLQQQQQQQQNQNIWKRGNQQQIIDDQSNFDDSFEKYRNPSASGSETKQEKLKKIANKRKKLLEKSLKSKNRDQSSSSSSSSDRKISKSKRRKSQKRNESSSSSESDHRSKSKKSKNRHSKRSHSKNSKRSKKYESSSSSSSSESEDRKSKKKTKSSRKNSRHNSKSRRQESSSSSSSESDHRKSKKRANSKKREESSSSSDRVKKNSRRGSKIRFKDVSSSSESDRKSKKSSHTLKSKKRDSSSDEDKKNRQVALYGGKNKKKDKKVKTSDCTALELPSNIHKNNKKSKSKVHEDHKHHMPQYPIGEDGKPKMPSLEELGQPISYPGYPELEYNFGNPTGDPNLQLSKYNQHNNLVEDFQSQGYYKRIQQDTTDVKLEDLSSAIQTKTIVEQKKAEEIKIKEDVDDGFTGQLVIMVSIGLFIISIIYHFLSSSENVDDIETAEKLLGGGLNAMANEFGTSFGEEMPL